MASDLPVYEKLGAFYIGRAVDPVTGEASREPLLYDSADLLTHAVIVGMTGSGKTGLGVGLLEEAALDGIPALILDPKGDMGNLLLTFPELAAGDFEPWVDAGAAERKGKSRQDYAASQAELWRQGLGEWGQDGERIRRLRQAAEVTLYTPGSEAGLPLSILGSFAAPPQAIRDDADLLGDRITTLVGGLLGLLGVAADPVTSREHILLANLLAERWRQGESLDLARLIRLIQEPGIQRIGVMDLETFYPAKDRFQLAMTVNNLLASPGMAAWLAGDPLSVDRLLYTPEGKPRLAVLTLSHLSDSERMFFVSLLLAEVVAWMRGRSGTTSLQALLYMDEVFGFLPPVAEPPSKRPLLTLLKQARAFGLGTVLATQNPADLDYKALSNAGTWFLGRLQTERDKERVLAGLAGASGAGFDRARLGELLAGLSQRVFLLHNVHEPEPLLFHTRWVLSYLKGPMTRQEIRRLTEERAGEGAAAQGQAAQPAPAAAAGGPAAGPHAGPPASPGRPILPPEVPETFLVARGRGEEITYRPALLGLARVHFVDSKRGVEHAEELAWLLPLEGDTADWRSARDLDRGSWDPERDLEPQPLPGAAFASLPSAAAQAGSYKAWEKDIAEVLYRDRRLDLFESPLLGLSSQPGESERDFRIRLGERARELRDEEKEKLRGRYAAKLDSQEARVRRAAERVEREEEQAAHQKRDTWLSVGETALSVLFGRKALSRSNVGRASSVLRRVSRSSKEAGDVRRAEEELAAQQEGLKELNAELEAELAALAERYDPQNLSFDAATLRPRRTDVEVQRVSLAWVGE